VCTGLKAVAARDGACDDYRDASNRSNKRRNSLAEFNGAGKYDNRVMNWSGRERVSGLRCRRESRCGAAVVAYTRGCLFGTLKQCNKTS